MCTVCSFENIPSLPKGMIKDSKVLGEAKILNERCLQFSWHAQTREWEELAWLFHFRLCKRLSVGSRSTEVGHSRVSLDAFVTCLWAWCAGPWYFFIVNKWYNVQVETNCLGLSVWKLSICLISFFSSPRSPHSRLPCHSIFIMVFACVPAISCAQTFSFCRPDRHYENADPDYPVTVPLGSWATCCVTELSSPVDWVCDWQRQWCGTKSLREWHGFAFKILTISSVAFFVYWSDSANSVRVALAIPEIFQPASVCRAPSEFQHASS